MKPNDKNEETKTAIGYVESKEWEEEKMKQGKETTVSKDEIDKGRNINLTEVSVLPTMTVKQEKLHIIKNTIIISIAFMLLFTAYNSMANLQSSINKLV